MFLQSMVIRKPGGGCLLSLAKGAQRLHCFQDLKHNNPLPLLGFRRSQAFCNEVYLTTASHVFFEDQFCSVLDTMRVFELLELRRYVISRAVV